MTKKNTIAALIAARGAECGALWIQREAGVLKDALKASGLNRRLTTAEAAILWVNTTDFATLEAAGHIVELCPELSGQAYGLVKQGLRYREVAETLQAGLDIAGILAGDYPVATAVGVYTQVILGADVWAAAQAAETAALLDIVMWPEEILLWEAHLAEAALAAAAPYWEKVGKESRSSHPTTVRWMGAYGRGATVADIAAFEAAPGRPVSAEAFRFGQSLGLAGEVAKVGLVVDTTKTVLLKAYAGDACTADKGRISSRMLGLVKVCYWGDIDRMSDSMTEDWYIEAFIESPVYQSVVYLGEDPPQFARDLAEAMGLPLTRYDRVVDEVVDPWVGGAYASEWEEAYA